MGPPTCQTLVDNAATPTMMTARRPAPSKTHRYSWAYNPPPSSKAHSNPTPNVRLHPISRERSSPASNQHTKRRAASRTATANIPTQSRSSVAISDPPRTPPDQTPVTAPQVHSQEPGSQRAWFIRSTSAPVMSRRPSKVKLKRWDAVHGITRGWDGLRRDDELWFPEGDCLVHLYAKGQSQRGPSFRVPFQVVHRAQCDPLFSMCYAQLNPVRQGNSSAPEHSILDEFPNTGKYEAYIPAPVSCMRDQALSWHLATRNFFSFLFLKPLVGLHLGQAIVDLRERLHMFRSEEVDNERDLHAYLQALGYLDFAHNPDYALAILFYAEKFQLRDLWIDAFAHCVGMNEVLSLSPEFKPSSQVTKALISRAYLEMDLHISRVVQSLNNFLDEEFSATYLGLGQGARAHLERFRSFLHSFYVDKFGYWPPPKGAAFSKALYRSMYFDFRALYEYLADTTSSGDITQQPPATGGICVLQNVQAFDDRHKYEPLPHPLCLLPELPKPYQRRDSQRGLLILKLGTKEARREHYQSSRNSLTAASNIKIVSPGSSALLRSFMKFERDWSSTRQEERVTITDARKVRWLLIYGILQKLISVIRAPPEVRDTDEPTYPLCALMMGVPPWKNEVPETRRQSLVPSININGNTMSSHIGERVVSPAPRSPGTSIHPDCDDEYFGDSRTCSLHRADSLTIPAPLRMPSVKEPALSRNSSILKLKNLAFSSFGSRRNSNKNRRSTASLGDLLSQGQTNGQATFATDKSNHRNSLTPSMLEQLQPDNVSLVSSRLRTPTLETFQLDPLHSFNQAVDFNEAVSPPPSPIWSSDASAPSSRTDSVVEQRTNNTTPIASFYSPGRHGRVWVPQSPSCEKADRMTMNTDCSRASVCRPQSCESMTPSIRIGMSKVDIYSAVKLLRRTMPIQEDVAESHSPSSPSSVVGDLPTLHELKLEIEGRQLRSDKKPYGRKMIRSSVDFFNGIGWVH